MEVKSSGMLVAIETTVRPIIVAGILSKNAMSEDPLVSKSPPQVSKATPTIKIRLRINSDRLSTLKIGIIQLNSQYGLNP